MSSVIIHLPDEESTIQLGKRVAKLLKPGSVLVLEGELGAGKTTLCRGVISELGGKPEQVTSPTFTLVNEYVVGDFLAQHCDFTRLPEGDLLDDFGGLEFFAEPHFYITEWISRLGFTEKSFKNHMVMVEISYDGSGRSAKISDRSAKDLQFLK